MENTLIALFFPSLCLKSLLQRNQGVNYDEAQVSRGNQIASQPSPTQAPEWMPMRSRPGQVGLFRVRCGALRAIEEWAQLWDTGRVQKSPSPMGTGEG